tara:strand:+ start:1140 stop:3230 length:2091 start_codon:yes stop_codon:yes gene_type:complete
MSEPKFKSINTSSGAPLKVRAVVGNFDDPERRLEALKQYYPDAVSTAGTPMGDDNFIYTDPESGQKTLYNPKGFDTGDIVSVGRDVVSGIAGSIGGASAFVGGQLGPQIAIPEEIVTVPAGYALASEGAGQMYDRAVDAFLPEPFSINRGGLLEQGSKAATNIGMEMVGGKLVEKVADVVKSAPSAITRKVLGAGQKRRQDARFRISEGEKYGMDMPSAGTVSQSPFLMFLEQRMKDFPTGNPVISETFNNFRLSAAQAVRDVASNYGKISQEGGEIGGILQKGLGKGFKKFQEDQKNLYDAAYDLAPNAVGRMNNIIELQSKLLDDLKKAPKSLMPSMKSALDETQSLIDDSQRSGGFDLSTIRQLRTNLRRKTDGMTQQGGGDAVSYLRTVYKALTDDMNEAVINYGGADAQKALSKADIYTKNRQKFDVDPVYDALHQSKKNELQAFSFLMQGTKESGIKLKKILRNVPQAERGDIQASILSRLGMTSPAGQDAIEDFSTAKFLTNYSKLADSSKNALFGKGKYRSDLDKLIKLFDDVKSADAFANNSRTGQTIGFTATLSPLVGAMAMVGQGSDIGTAATTAAVGLTGAALAPYVTSRLLTNPKFISWLVKSGPQMGKVKNGASFHLGRLMEISSRDAQFREDAIDYINAFGSSFLDSNQEPVVEEEVDASLSPALQSLIKTTDPSLLNRIN